MALRINDLLMANRELLKDSFHWRVYVTQVALEDADEEPITVKL